MKPGEIMPRDDDHYWHRDETPDGSWGAVDAGLSQGGSYYWRTDWLF